MLRLLLLRHAKAEPATGAGDFARPLSVAGRHQAETVGLKVGAEFGSPNLILCSPARRTRETLQGLLSSLQPPPDVRFIDELYSGDAETYRSVIKLNSQAAETVLVVAHNPALRDLAVDLVSASESARLTRFPVATLAEIVFPAEHWDVIDGGKGRLSALFFTESAEGN